MAFSMEFTGSVGTVVRPEGAKECEPAVVPYVRERIVKNVPQKKLLRTEKKIAGVDRTVGHHAELGSSRGAADTSKFGIFVYVRKKPPAVNRACHLPEGALYLGFKTVKRHSRMKVVLGYITVDEVEFFRSRRKNLLDQRSVRLRRENRLDDGLMLADETVYMLERRAVIHGNANGNVFPQVHDPGEDIQIRAV